MNLNNSIDATRSAQVSSRVNNNVNIVNRRDTAFTHATQDMEIETGSQNEQDNRFTFQKKQAHGELDSKKDSMMCSELGVQVRHASIPHLSNNSPTNEDTKMVNGESEDESLERALDS